MATRTRSTAHERTTPEADLPGREERACRRGPRGAGRARALGEARLRHVPTHPEERRILDRLRDEGVTASDAVRRGLHLVAHEKWVDQARIDAENLAHENLDDEPDAW